jgi:flagella basal body P-ring formation protein FlgA
MTIRSMLALVFSSLAFTAYAGEPGTIDIVVPAHDIARGAIVTAADLAYKPLPASQIGDSVVRNAADLEGQEARRSLRAGEPLRLADVRHPVLVAKGATVTMIFEAPGISLSATGRALAEGGEGDSITVLNPVSYRQVQATVIAPGTVRVGNVAPATVASAR